MTPNISHSILLQRIANHSESTPEKVAFVTVDDKEVSYSSLWENIQLAGAYLINCGLQKGDKLLLSAQKEIEFIYFYFGAHLAGITNVIVDAKNNAAHLEYIASIVNPKLALGCQVSDVLSANYSDIFLCHSESKETSPISNSTDIADIMFTSGTTGLPKGVKLSHANVAGSAANINGYIGNDSSDVELLALPICHSFGLGRIRCNMMTGATLVLRNGFANLKDIFSTMEQYNVTGFGMVPAVWAYIKRFSGNRISKFAEQLRYIEIGSAPMALEDKKLLLDIFPKTRICMHYGLTEASRSLFMEFHTDVADLSTIGSPVSKSVSVKILDEQGKEVNSGVEGELCVSGNMVMESYLLEADNNNAFWGKYFRTGDWAYRDASGKFFLIARKKELINIGGKKVSPLEIEDALVKIGVAESMCVAIKDPEGILGEVPKVLLVDKTFTHTVDEIKHRLSELIEPYKMPRVFEIVKSIPKTASGKKQRICQN